MTTTGDGKDLPLTRYAIEKATQQERLSYGVLIGTLIDRSDISQKDLAEASGVTARTIRNITQGKVAPQADKIIGLLLALNIDVDDTIDADVRPYTKMLAPVIRRIDPEYRAAAVSDAIGLLSDAALAHPDEARLAPVTRMQPRPDVRATPEDLAEVAYETEHDYSDDTDDKYIP